jgi:predicted metal-dependent HD superfamily phosphohydrolase
MTRLENSWKQTFDDLGLSRPPTGPFEALCARYSEPGRAYHTLQHLEECFSHLGAVRARLEQPGEVAFALFYHDAIYDTHASDNEERSADLALEVLRNCGAVDNSRRDRIRRLVLTTRHDAKPEWHDAAYLVDIDLSILGAPASRFDEYEAQIRSEYAWVPAPEFRTGRARVLRQFLDRPKIYATEDFANRIELTARANLTRSLNRLGA